MASLLAERILVETESSQEIRGDQERAGQLVRRAWSLALGRQPSENERRESVALMERLGEHEKVGVKTFRTGLERLCWTLFNLNEFLFAD